MDPLSLGCVKSRDAALHGQIVKFLECIGEWCDADEDIESRLFEWTEESSDKRLQYLYNGVMALHRGHEVHS